MSCCPCILTKARRVCCCCSCRTFCWTCCGLTVFVILAMLIAFASCTGGFSPTSMAAPLVDIKLDGDPLLGWWNMPRLQPWDSQEMAKNNLSPLDYSQFLLAPYLNSTWGETSAEEAADIMYQATRVSGVF